MASDTSSTADAAKKKNRITALVIIRHAERIDDHRIPGGFVDNGKCNKSKQRKKQTSTSPFDWRYDTEAGRSRPWDPPLSYGGIEQSEAFGKLLPHLIEDFKLPPLGAAYASPVVRCAETALVAVRAHDAEALVMEKEKEGAKEKRAAASAAAGNVSSASNGTQAKGGRMKATTGKKNELMANEVPPPSSPTSPSGHELATALGTAHIHVPSISKLLNTALDTLGIENESAIAVNSASTDTTTVASTADTSTCSKDENVIQKPSIGSIEVKLEQGLMECIHKPWYDQWCITGGVAMQGVAGGSGRVVGEHGMTLHGKEGAGDEKKAEEENIHPMARVPVVHCFPEPRDMVNLLGGVVRSYVREQGKNTTGVSLTLLPDKNSDQQMLQDMLGRVDTKGHLKPFSTFLEDYIYETQYETGKAGLNRQHAAVRAIAAHHVGETILCVTHFVPCAHIFGRLTGRDGVVEHGKAGYTAFSVYVHSDGREGEKHKDWRPLIINDQRHLAVPQQEVARPARKKYNLRSRLYGF